MSEKKQIEALVDAIESHLPNGIGQIIRNHEIGLPGHGLVIVDRAHGYTTFIAAKRIPHTRDVGRESE